MRKLIANRNIRKIRTISPYLPRVISDPRDVVKPA